MGICHTSVILCVQSYSSQFSMYELNDIRFGWYVDLFTDFWFHLVEWELLSGVYARGSKRPHTGGKCVTCSGFTNSHWTLKRPAKGPVQYLGERDKRKTWAFAFSSNLSHCICRAIINVCCRLCFRPGESVVSKGSYPSSPRDQLTHQL